MFIARHTVVSMITTTKLRSGNCSEGCGEDDILPALCAKLLTMPGLCCVFITEYVPKASLIKQMTLEPDIIIASLILESL